MHDVHWLYFGDPPAKHLAQSSWDTDYTLNGSS